MESAIRQRILIVSNVYPPQIIGGAEIVAHRQASALAQAGFDVFILGGKNRDSSINTPRIYVQSIDGLRVFRIAAPAVPFEEGFRRTALFDYIKLVFSLTKPDIVHLHNLPGIGAGIAVYAKESGAKVLATMHDTWGFCMRQTMLRPDSRLCQDMNECDLCHASVMGDHGEHLPIRMRRDYVRWCLDTADLMLFPSRTLMDSYIQSGFDRSRCQVLSNGINLKGFPPRLRTPQGQVTFMCASTLGDHKGVRLLWDALENLLQDTSLLGLWSMTLGGEGPLAPELKARFSRGSLHEPVRWSGFIPRNAMPTAVDRADVIILASIWPENEPVTLLEAIASGAALVGTDIGGVPELIEDGRSGLLVPPGDAEALAKAMKRLILDPALVTSFSARNIERRDSFDETRSIQSLMQIMAAPVDLRKAQYGMTVLCWGELSDISSDSEVSRRLRGIGVATRMIWHDWFDQEFRFEPDLICVFGNVTPYGAIARAVFFQKPILIPKHIGLADNLIERALVYEYDTEIDALDMIDKILVEIPCG